MVLNCVGTTPLMKDILDGVFVATLQYLSYSMSSHMTVMQALPQPWQQELQQQTNSCPGWLCQCSFLTVTGPSLNISSNFSPTRNQFFKNSSFLFSWSNIFQNHFEILTAKFLAGKVFFCCPSSESKSWWNS